MVEESDQVVGRFFGAWPREKEFETRLASMIGTTIRKGAGRPGR